MAKQLKRPKCPHCGSAAKTELRPGYFRCSNCNTEYALNNDGIEALPKIEHGVPPAAAPRKGLKSVGVVSIVILGLAAIVFFVARKLNPSKIYSAPSFVEAKEVDEHKFNWYSHDKTAYISADGKPIEVVLGERAYRGGNADKKQGVYVTFYDLQTGKSLKSLKVLGTFTEARDGDYSATTFENGDVYFTIEQKYILKVEKATLSLIDVTQSLFAQHPELNSGIANVQFFYKQQGDGFNLLTNKGAELNYFYLQDRLYTKEQMRTAENALNVEQAGEPLKTAFAFSSESEDYPEEKIQLIRYTQRDPQGGPNSAPSLSWYKDLQTNAKTLFRFGKGVVRTWKDFTPGRQYFNADVLYSDKDVVVIWFANAPAEKVVKSLQCLNAETGEIIFTLPLGTDYYLREVVRYKDGFVIENQRSTLLVSNAGKWLNEFKVDRDL